MNPSPLPVGRGSAQVLTPAAIGTAVRVGKTRKFRKMLMPRMTIKANGRRIDLASYFKDLAQAEREGAFPSIPLQVNANHTPDPRYTEGTVSNLVHLVEGPDGDGLYGDIEFADDDGAKLVDKNPKVGVSVSMVENLVRHEDDKVLRWPAALQHVLMTTDPHVRQTGGGWHPIQLGRAEVGETIDLSGSTYTELEEPMTAPTQTEPPEGQAPEGTGDGDMVELRLPKEDAELLTGFLADLRNADQDENAGGRGSAGDQGAPGSATPPDGDGSGAPRTELQRQDEGDDNQLNLMRTEIETERTARLELERELDRSRVENELFNLGETGLAPAIIEAARPLLEAPRGQGVIELSRGAGRRPERIDPGAILRNVLSTVIELSRHGMGVIDLDREVGMHIGGEAERTERQAVLAAMNDQYGSD